MGWKEEPASQAYGIRIGPWGQNDYKCSRRLTSDEEITIHNMTAYDTESLAEVIRVGMGNLKYLHSSSWGARAKSKMMMFEVAYFGGSKEDLGFSGKPMVKLTRTTGHEDLFGMEVHSIKLVKPGKWTKYVDDMTALEASVSQEMPRSMVAQLIFRAFHIGNNKAITANDGASSYKVEYLERLAKYVDAPTYGEEPSADELYWRLVLKRKMLSGHAARTKYKTADINHRHKAREINQVSARLAALMEEEPKMAQKKDERQGAWSAIRAEIEEYLEKGLECGVKP